MGCYKGSDICPLLFWLGTGADHGALAAAQVVKAPGNLVISAYVTCPDITLTVTPDLKLPGSGKLLWVDLGQNRRRLGGSALAHAYSQVSNATEMLCMSGCGIRSPAALSARLTIVRLLLQSRSILHHMVASGGPLSALTIQC